ncbi:uncharacterized protein LOC128820402 [Vidua macroura]|uniref:uncharacterized protein LOC128820402 n=1 Tax=Vidua macroura TaxID=187451 RepID=UPI0023A7BB0D|nr:uncharacterized protein LOC128820402 [Vidua macroura]
MEWLPLPGGRDWWDIGKKFFLVRVERPWHRVPREAVAAPSLEEFKARLDRAWSNVGQWKVSLPMAGAGTGWALRSLPTQTSLGFYLLQFYLLEFYVLETTWAQTPAPVSPDSAPSHPGHFHRSAAVKHLSSKEHLQLSRCRNPFVSGAVAPCARQLRLDSLPCAPGTSHSLDSLPRYLTQAGFPAQVPHTAWIPCPGTSHGLHSLPCVPGTSHRLDSLPRYLTPAAFPAQVPHTGWIPCPGTPHRLHSLPCVPGTSHSLDSLPRYLTQPGLPALCPRYPTQAGFPAQVPHTGWIPCPGTSHSLDSLPRYLTQPGFPAQVPHTGCIPRSSQ